MRLIWLGDPRCHDRALVGGKAARLSRLAVDHDVLPGFRTAAIVAAGLVALLLVEGVVWLFV